MRSSPITHLNPNHNSGQSPYKDILQNRSNKRQGYTPDRISKNDAEYWRLKANNLEKDIMALTQDLMFKERRLLQQDQLQEKIQVLLAQNSHLADQNQNLIRLIQQKKSQIQLWKSKFEGEYNHSSIAEAQKRKIFDHLNIKDQQYQIQIDRLLSQISRLHDQIQQIENLKQLQISSLKNKYQNEAMNQIQNLKRSQYGNHQLQQLNIRKLKDTLQQKDFEIENLRRQSKLQNERLNGDIAYFQNQIKKLQHQKIHEIQLIKAENQNTRNNLIRAHHKNQEELRNLHQTKIKRLIYQIEQKKHQIQQFQGKIKKGGKENQIEINQMANDKSKLRLQIKQNDNNNRRRIIQLTKFYQKQLQENRNNNNQKQKNLIILYDNQIKSLKEVLQLKQQQIERLLTLNTNLKINQQQRLKLIKQNNQQLKNKIQEIVLHYQRQIQLLKIKISQLYQADLEVLRNNMRNRLSAHTRERDNLRQLLVNISNKLAIEVQQKLDLRKDYQNRLTQFKIKYQRQHQQLQDLITMHQKNYESQVSKASLSHISHTNIIQQQNVNRKQLMIQKRNLQKQILQKNKQIEILNLRIQKIQGFNKRQIQKLQEDLNQTKTLHQQWLEKQNKQNQDWNRQRSQFKENIHNLDKKYKDIQNKKKQNQENYQKKIQEKSLKIAYLEGTIEELQSKGVLLESKIKVQAQNIEKTYLETQSLMNDQKAKLLETKQKQLKLKVNQFQENSKRQKAEFEDLKKENDLLRDRNEKSKIRQAQLSVEISTLLDSVNKRSQLQENVINIGLSNNYFKNVAQIFKKAIQN